MLSASRFQTSSSETPCAHGLLRTSRASSAKSPSPQSRRAKPEQDESRRQQPAVGQVVDRRDQLLAGQVAGDAEDDERARVGHPRQPAVAWIAQRIGPLRESFRHFCAPSCSLMASMSCVQESSNFSTPSSSSSVDDVVVVDAEGFQVVEHRAGRRRSATDRVALDHAVVGDRVQGGFRHGVDGVRRDEVGDVQGVGVAGSFTPVDAQSGRWVLAPAAASAFQRSLEDHVLVVLVGQPGVGDGGLAAQRLGLLRADLVEPLVDLGVDPGDEERRDGADARTGRCPAFCARSRPVEERVHHRVVAVQAEDQRDVDADALRQRLADRRQAPHGGRDLDEQVRPVDEPPQRPRLGDGLARCRARDPRVDLDGDPAVDAVARVVHRPQHVAGVADVVGGDRTQRLADVDAADRQVGQLPS